MGTCLRIGLTNAVSAAVLAVFVAAFTRLWRNPHLAHALWLIVLLRLVAPPVFQFAWPAPAWLTRATVDVTPLTSGDTALEASPTHADFEPSDLKSAPTRPVSAGDAPHPRSVQPAGTPAPVDLPRGPTPNASTIPSSATAPPVARSVSLFDLCGGLWVLGTALYLGLTIVRVRRFGRAIWRFRSLPPDWLADEISELSRAIGLRRSPRLAVVDAAVPPMVWSGWRPTLLVPKKIVDSLDPSQRRLLLLHELWHVRRADHRTRWFAVAVLALHWWNPVAWWAVRRLQNAEEECCDAAVLSLHPQQPEIYGEALLAVSEFVSHGSLPAAAVSIGVERKNHLKRRMTMILKGTRWPRLSKGRLAVVAICGVLAIGVSLTTAAPQSGTAPKGKSSTKSRSTTATLQSSKTSPSPTAAAPPGDKTSVYGWKSLLVTPDDDARHKLLKLRFNAALGALEQYRRQQQVGHLPSLGDFLVAGKHVRDADLALNDKPPGDLEVLEKYLAFTKDLEQLAEKKLAAGVGGGNAALERAELREARLAAEIEFNDRQRATAAKFFKPRPQPETQPVPAKSDQAIPLPARRSIRQGTAMHVEPLPELLKAKPLEPAAGDSELQKLLKERYNAALSYLRRSYRRFHAMEWTPENVLDAARRVVDAELALSAAPAAETGVRERYLELAKLVDAQAQKMAASGQMRQEDADAAHEARLDAEIKLLQAQSVSSTNPRAEKKAGSISPVLQSLQTRVRIAQAEVIASHAAVAQSQAELKRAQANLKYRQFEFHRLQTLRKQNVVSDGAMEDAIRARDDAAASVDVAKASIEAAKAQVEIKQNQLQQAQFELQNAKAGEAR